jgi:hypothetical protein
MRDERMIIINSKLVVICSEAVFNLRFVKGMSEFTEGFEVLVAQPTFRLGTV